ncbi:sensor histidine kinase [Luteipulveratus halotolerans]|nr:sensor histidine kinase [Luteipulveratus halotolerans]
MNIESRYDVLRRRPRLLDGLVVGGLMVFTVFTMAFASWWLVLLSAAMVGPLWWRRTHPLACALVLAVVCVLRLAVHREMLPADIAPLFAIYATAAYGERRSVCLTGLGLGLLGAALGTARWAVTPAQDDLSGKITAVGFSMVGLTLVVLATWFLGDVLRTRRAVLDQLQAQNAALERDQEQRAALAAKDERTRIAREMHDIVAHSLSVVVVQADGGAYAARSGSRSPQDAVDAAATTLETIGATAREALAETRRLVGVLRAPDTELELAPQAGLDEIVGVVERTSTAGVPTSLQTIGATGDVSREVGLAAYRVVQESLTNVMKHAGQGASASVRIERTADALTVTVTDDGLGTAARDDGDGNGIAGMRERVAVYGGSLEARPRAVRGFVVTATIPVADSPATSTPVTARSSA